MRRNAEERVLLLCARQGFEEKHARAVEELARNTVIDWDRVAETARWHRVVPVVQRNLARCRGTESWIPRGPWERLVGLARELRAEKLNRFDGLEEFLMPLGAAVPVMFVKGAALDTTVYEEPWLTFSHDFDLLIECSWEELGADRQAWIKEGMKRLGYLEVDCEDHHDLSINRSLPIDYREVWRDSRAIRWRGLPVRVPSSADLFLFSAINCCRKKFFHLKALCDLDAIVSRCTDLDWESVVAKAHRYEVDSIVYAAMLALSRLLGTDVPHDALAALQPGLLRRSLIRSLLRAHSFVSLRLLHRPKSERSRRAKLGLLLPYACYHWKQCRRFLRRDLQGLARRARRAFSRSRQGDPRAFR